AREKARLLAQCCKVKARSRADSGTTSIIIAAYAGRAMLWTVPSNRQLPRIIPGWEDTPTSSRVAAVLSWAVSNVARRPHRSASWPPTRAPTAPPAPTASPLVQPGTYAGREMDTPQERFPRRDDEGRVLYLPDLLGLTAAGLVLCFLVILAYDVIGSLIGWGEFGAASGWLALILPAWLFLIDELRAWQGVRARLVVVISGALVALAAG